MIKLRLSNAFNYYFLKAYLLHLKMMFSEYRIATYIKSDNTLKDTGSQVLTAEASESF